MQAVVQPYKALLQTLLIMVIMLSIFALGNFLFYQDDFIDGECETAASCWLYIVFHGKLNGGGIAKPPPPTPFGHNRRIFIKKS